MKKRYRDKALNELVAQLESADFDQREHALFQLAQVFRGAYPDDSTRDLSALDAESLSRELRRARLSVEEQGRMVDVLTLLFAGRRESRATALWTLGEVSAEIGWAPTMALLDDYGHQLDEEAAFQACRALGRWLESMKHSGMAVETKISETHLSWLLKSWAASDNDRLGRQAGAVVALLRELEM